MTDITVPRQPHPNADELLALLRERRSIYDFLPHPVPMEILERALDAGRFAPNHKLSEPWRFTIVGPATKAAVAAPWSLHTLRKVPPNASEERRTEALAASRKKWMSKPLAVVVSQVLNDDSVRREEDYAAVACAMQNIQLAAWALGLGCQWSTSPATRDREVLELIGVPETERVVGFLFVGYPDGVPECRRRPLAEVLRRTA
jgi:nitroreductase